MACLHAITPWQRTERTRAFLGKCPHCKTALRRDFPVYTRLEQHCLDTYPYPRHERHTARAMAEDGTELRWWHGKVIVPCPACGQTIQLTKIDGAVNPSIRCNARCLSATGPHCECACGGENHGGQHAH